MQQGIASAPRRRKRRGTETSGDMVRSLLVVGGVTAAVLLAGASRQLLFPTGDNAVRVRVVDASNEIAAARRLAPGQVSTPQGLGAGWRITSARLNPHGRAVDLHLGYVTPGEKYAELEETTGEADRFVQDVLDKGSTALPPVRIDGREWDQRRTRKGELALLRTAGPTTVIVTGNASPAELTTLVRSLR